MFSSIKLLDGGRQKAIREEVMLKKILVNEQEFDPQVNKKRVVRPDTGICMWEEYKTQQAGRRQS